MGAVGLLLSCAPPEDEAEAGSTRQDVILSAMGSGFELATGTGALATGAIFVPQLLTNGAPQFFPGTTTPIRATCGVTFVSPHFAITAGHCVAPRDVPNPVSQSFVVETYDISGLTAPLPTELSGTFPNYTHPVLGPLDGYQVHSLRCSVVVRCNGTGFNCPAAAADADIAMLSCGDRPATEEFPYVAVAEFDPTFGAVEMFWPHEILNVPNTRPQAPGMLDLYEHYKIWEPSHVSNFHYHPNNQLFPLHSTPFPGGQVRQRLGASSGGVMTDLFGCHGSSGSGVMQRNGGVLELLGPARNAGSGWMEPGSTRNLLCLDIAQQAPLTHHLSYTDSSATRALNVEAQADRDWAAWLTAVEG